MTLLLMLLPGAFFAPIIHEFVKARVSAALGDPTPEKNGFITFNPFKFFEPIGFFMMLFFHVGWGQPAKTSHSFYRDKRKGIALTYTAPIVANLLVGVTTIWLFGILQNPLLEWAAGYGVSAWTLMGLSVVTVIDIPWELMSLFVSESPLIVQIVFFITRSLFVFGMMNIGLALFNLIPVYPLAANKLLLLYVSPETAMRLTHYEKPLQILLFMLLIFDVVARIIFPIQNAIAKLVMF
jgi:hypothetical protein